MENHGITMKGKYFMEQASAPAAAASSERRIIYNTSTSINGATDQYGGYKMFFHNNSKWLRPLCGNVDDGPDVDDTRSLGSVNYRFSDVWATNIHGAVRYS